MRSERAGKEEDFMFQDLADAPRTDGLPPERPDERDKVPFDVRRGAPACLRKGGTAQAKTRRRKNMSAVWRWVRLALEARLRSSRRRDAIRRKKPDKGQPPTFPLRLAVRSVLHRRNLPPRPK